MSHSLASSSDGGRYKVARVKIIRYNHQLYPSIANTLTTLEDVRSGDLKHGIADLRSLLLHAESRLIEILPDW